MEKKRPNRWPDDRSEPEGEGMKFTVVYPNLLRESGRAIAYEDAVLVVYEDKALGIMPTIELNREKREKKVFILDPRAIVFNETTATVDYSPRYYDIWRHAPWCRKWLHSHPDWGQPGCEQDWKMALREFSYDH